jgi:hypothetical protein
LQPFAQDGREARVVHPQQAGQAWQRCGRCGGRRRRQAEKRQACRRGLSAAAAQKPAHRFQPPDFEGGEALAQRGLQGVFPAGFNVDAAPQAGHALQPLALEPGLQFRGGLELFLQRLQGFHARRELCQAGTLGVHRLLARAALVVQQGHRVLQFGQARGLGLSHFARFIELRLQVLQTGFVGRSQGIFVGAQALKTLFLLALLFLQAALLGGQHLDLLLHLHHGSALVVVRLRWLARSASSRSGSTAACSSTCAASISARSSASMPAPVWFSSSAWASLLRPAHSSACAASCTRRCSTRWRPSMT